jgi:hypothetical protein
MKTSIIRKIVGQKLQNMHPEAYVQETEICMGFDTNHGFTDHEPDKFKKEFTDCEILSFGSNREECGNYVKSSFSLDAIILFEKEKYLLQCLLIDYGSNVGLDYNLKKHE